MALSYFDLCLVVLAGLPFEGIVRLKLRCLSGFAIGPQEWDDFLHSVPHSMNFPMFRQVLECGSPLPLWLPPHKKFHGLDARPILEVEVPQVQDPNASSKKDGGFP
jgi:hypothetical protein